MKIKRRAVGAVEVEAENGRRADIEMDNKNKEQADIEAKI
jgi:hypothetical protein